MKEEIVLHNNTGVVNARNVRNQGDLQNSQSVAQE